MTSSYANAAKEVWSVCGASASAADRLEVAELGPGPEPARETVRLLLIDVGPQDVGLVREPRADVLDALFDLQLVVVPVDDVQRDAHAFDHAVAQVAQAHVEAPDAAVGLEIDLDLFFMIVPVLVVGLFLFRVVVVAVSVVMTVELVRERHAIAAILRCESAAREEPVTEPAQTGARVHQLGGGVLDGARGRVVVVRAPHAAAAPDEQVPLRVLQTGDGARLGIPAADIGAELHPRAVKQ